MSHNFSPNPQPNDAPHIVLIADTHKQLYRIHSQLPYFPNVTEIWLGDDLPDKADSLLYISQCLARSSGGGRVYQPLWVFMDITMYPDLAIQIAMTGRAHDVFLVGCAPSRQELPSKVRGNVKIMTDTSSLTH